MNEPSYNLDIYLIRGWLIAGWKIIAAITLVAMFGTYVVTKLFMAPIYQAEAEIRPNLPQQRAIDLLGPMSTLAATSVSLGAFGTAASTQAEEYISIMKSFDFTKKLLAKYKFENHIFPNRQITHPQGFLHRLGILHTPTQFEDWDDYRIYRLMQDKFDAKYDLDSGNMALTFVDEDPAWAKRILGWYIDEFRSVIRQQELDQTKPAYDALRAEAATTGDPVIAAQVEDLAARQLVRLELAGVQTEFAFKVVQSAVVPDRPKSPHPTMDALIAGITALLASSLWIITIGSFRRTRAEDVSKQPLSVAFRK